MYELHCLLETLSFRSKLQNAGWKFGSFTCRRELRQPSHGDALKPLGTIAWTPKGVLAGRADQPRQGVRFPETLQSLTFGLSYDQAMEGVTLPPSLQSLTFGFRFNRSIQNFRVPMNLGSQPYPTFWTWNSEDVCPIPLCIYVLAVDP